MLHVLSFFPDRGSGVIRRPPGGMGGERARLAERAVCGGALVLPVPPVLVEACMVFAVARVSASTGRAFRLGCGCEPAIADGSVGGVSAGARACGRRAVGRWMEGNSGGGCGGAFGGGIRLSRGSRAAAGGQGGGAAPGAHHGSAHAGRGRTQSRFGSGRFIGGPRAAGHRPRLVQARWRPLADVMALARNRSARKWSGQARRAGSIRSTGNITT